MLAEFSEKQNIPYPLLSDVDSEVIRLFGILNSRLSPGDAMLRRLFLRKARAHPLGLLRFIVKSIKLELAARRRGA